MEIPPEVYFRDYAGGVNVHAVGGLAGLVGCIFMGPRLGRFDTTRKYHIPGHSTPLTGLGAFILMTGFLGMVLGHGQNIELSATNIVLGGATSGKKCSLHSGRCSTGYPYLDSPSSAIFLRVFQS